MNHPDEEFSAMCALLTHLYLHYHIASPSGVLSHASLMLLAISRDMVTELS